MPFENYVKTFAGYPIKEYEPDKPLPEGDVAVRVALSAEDYYDGINDNPVDYYANFFKTPGLENIKALVFGCWNFEGEGDVSMIVKPLAKNGAKLRNLKALFLGDITSEDCEISWLEMSSLSKLWDAFPQLEVLWIRGSNNLKLGRVDYSNLRELVLQSGGLPKTVVNEVFYAQWTGLEHLELWLGTDGYGADTNVDSFKPLFAGNLFPKLKYLGLKNSEYTDDIAAAIVDSEILPRLEILDLSEGTLGDKGAEAILAAKEKFAHLKKLDLHHHFMSDEMMQRMSQMPCPTDVSEQEKEFECGNETFRFVSVAE